MEAELEGAKGFRSGVFAYFNAAGQAIPNFFPELLTLDTAAHDPLGEWDGAVNYRWRPRRAGIYLMVGKVRMAAGILAYQLRIRIYRDAGLIFVENMKEIPAGGTGYIQCSCVRYCDPSHFYDLRVAQNSGVAINTIGGADTFLQIQRLS